MGMTREEAINELNYLKKYYNDKDVDVYQGFDDEDNEAIDKAIRALEQDCISRTDMLDAIGHGTTYTTDELQKIIKGLPTVNLNSERSSL